MLTESEINAIGAGYLPGHLGVTFTSVAAGETHADLPLAQHLMAPNGYIHAGAIVTLADTCSGYGCMASLPDGAAGFTTIELKTNFLGTCARGHSPVRGHGPPPGQDDTDLGCRGDAEGDRQDPGAFSLHPNGPLLGAPAPEAGSAVLRK